jgi:hypothetical protein
VRRPCVSQQDQRRCPAGIVPRQRGLFDLERSFGELDAAGIRHSPAQAARLQHEVQSFGSLQGRRPALLVERDHERQAGALCLDVLAHGNQPLQFAQRRRLFLEPRRC